MMRKSPCCRCSEHPIFGSTLFSAPSSGKFCQHTPRVLFTTDFFFFKYGWLPLLLRPGAEHDEHGEGGQGGHLHELLPWRRRRDPLLVGSLHHRQGGQALDPPRPLHLLRALLPEQRLHRAAPGGLNFLDKNFVNISIILPQVSILVALIARMTANGAFNVCLQYSSEIFPTVIRGKGVRTPLHISKIDNQNKY